MDNLMINCLLFRNIFEVSSVFIYLKYVLIYLCYISLSSISQLLHVCILFNIFY